MSDRDPARELRDESDLSAAPGDRRQESAHLRHYCAACPRHFAEGLGSGRLCDDCRQAVETFDAVMATFHYPRHRPDSLEFWVTYYQLRREAGEPLWTDLNELRRALLTLRGVETTAAGTIRKGRRPGSGMKRRRRPNHPAAGGPKQPPAT